MDTQRVTLERLIRSHQAAIYRYVRYLGAERALAEDLVQETFLATLRPNPHQPVDTDDPAWPGWLRGIARNKYLAECRRRANQALPVDDQTLELAEAVWAATVRDESDWDDRLTALRQCLKRLPARQQEVLDHRYVHRTARDEMARLLGMTEDGIKSLLRRIRAILAQCIEERLRGSPQP